MIASFFELDGGRAVEAALPAFFFGDLGETSGGFVFRAFAPRVPAAIAGATDFCPAAAAFTVSPPAIYSTGSIEMDVGRLDPLAATAGWAIDAVFGRIFLIFLVPLHLKAEIEQLVDMLKRDVVVRATFRRHMLWVRDRKGEDAPEAGVAHAVSAGKFGRFRYRNVGEAG